MHIMSLFDSVFEYTLKIYSRFVPIYLHIFFFFSLNSSFLVVGYFDFLFYITRHIFLGFKGILFFLALVLLFSVFSHLPKGTKVVKTVVKYAPHIAAGAGAIAVTAENSVNKNVKAMDKRGLEHNASYLQNSIDMLTGDVTWKEGMARFKDPFKQVEAKINKVNKIYDGEKL